MLIDLRSRQPVFFLLYNDVNRTVSSHTGWRDASHSVGWSTTCVCNGQCGWVLTFKRRLSDDGSCKPWRIMTGKTIGWQPDDVTKPSQSALHDSVFHGVVVCCTMDLHMRNFVLPMKTKDLLQTVDMECLEGFWCDASIGSRLHSHAEG